MAESIKARNLLEAAEKGNDALMNEMKKSLNNKVVGQSIQECLDGKVAHDDILERFRECYQELYNSASSEDAMKTIKIQLAEVIREGSDSSASEIGKVTGQVVKEACSRMRPGIKNDVTGVYSIVMCSCMPQTLSLTSWQQSSDPFYTMGQ